MAPMTNERSFTITVGHPDSPEMAEEVAKAIRLVVLAIAVDPTDSRGCTVTATDPAPKWAL